MQELENVDGMFFTVTNGRKAEGSGLGGGDLAL